MFFDQKAEYGCQNQFKTKASPLEVNRNRLDVFVLLKKFPNSKNKFPVLKQITYIRYKCQCVHIINWVTFIFNYLSERLIFMSFDHLRYLIFSYIISLSLKCNLENVRDESKCDL